MASRLLRVVVNYLLLAAKESEQTDLLRPNGLREAVSGVSREQIRLLKTAAL